MRNKIKRYLINNLHINAALAYTRENHTIFYVRKSPVLINSGDFFLIFLLSIETSDLSRFRFERFFFIVLQFAECFETLWIVNQTHVLNFECSQRRAMLQPHQWIALLVLSVPLKNKYVSHQCTESIDDVRVSFFRIIEGTSFNSTFFLYKCVCQCVELHWTHANTIEKVLHREERENFQQTFDIQWRLRNRFCNSSGWMFSFVMARILRPAKNLICLAVFWRQLNFWPPLALGSLFLAAYDLANTTNSL